MSQNHSRIMNVICGSSDQPLVIAEALLPCYVLEDELRVITESGIMNALGLKYGGSGYKRAGDRNFLTGFITGEAIGPFASSELVTELENPILFKTTSPESSRIMRGYAARVLAEICQTVLSARRANKLLPQQSRIAMRCEILQGAFAEVGLIALIDEATGYEKLRDSYALRRALDQIVSTRLHDWIKTFHEDFYRELFRLRELDYNPNSNRRPGFIGRLTNDIVYDRIAPGLRLRLKEVVQKNQNGRPIHQLHRHMTRGDEGAGYQTLNAHLYAVTSMMRAAPDWDTFHRRLDAVWPRYNDTIPLPFCYPDEAN